MFGITDKLRAAATTGGLVAVAGILALMGLVWVTVAGFTVLALYVAPPVAMVMIGVALMIPLVIVLIQHRGSEKEKEKEKEKSEPVAAAAPSGEYAALARLAGSAQSLSEKSPLAGAALALGAAYFASRSPSTSSLAVQIIAEVVDQWAKSRPVAPTPAPETPDDPAI